MAERKRLSRREVGQAAQAACLLEAAAAKPGNVNRYADFNDTKLTDFLLSGMLIGPHMEKAHRRTVGETVLSSVRAVRRIVPVNTNLGIILLFTPLAAAYGKDNLRGSVGKVLLSMTVDDANYVYRAIRIAGPGGLGRVDRGDVAGDAEITLLESMRMASQRDSIAREYSTCFEITFGLGLPSLEGFLKRGLDFEDAVVNTSLAILSEVPDTLIARKKGPDRAAEVSRRASDALRTGGCCSGEGYRKVLLLDDYLRSEKNGLNPGATADLVAASIFVYLLKNGLSVWNRVRMH